MPRYSPIAPIHLLEELCDAGLLRGYLLLLAHEVYEQPARYEELVHNMRETYDDSFVIMDNGVVELGAPVNTGMLIEAANIVNADCIALPDIMGDLGATKKLIMESGLMSNEFTSMLIPQGENFSAVLQCVDWLACAFPPWEGKERIWGVPRWIANTLTTRAGVITYINQYYPQSKIHLLGMSNYINDDLMCVKMQRVMGIDSANPLVLGFYNFDLNHPDTRAHMKRREFWGAPELTELMIRNVQWMHDAVS